MSPRGALTLAAAALLAAVPAAHAVWTAGSGSATATTAAPKPLAIAQGAAATQSLYPTGTPTGDVAVSVTNPNPYRVHFRLSLDTTGGTGGYSALAAACGVQFTPPQGGWDIAPGATADLDLRDSLTLPTAAASSCQGLAVFVYLKAVP